MVTFAVQELFERQAAGLRGKRGVIFDEVRGGADERARIGTSASGEWEGEVVEAGVFGGGIATGVVFSDGGEGAAAVGFVLATARLIQVPDDFGMGRGIVAAALLDEGLDAELAVVPEGEVLRGEAAREVLVAAGGKLAGSEESGTGARAAGPGVGSGEANRGDEPVGPTVLDDLPAAVEPAVAGRTIDRGGDEEGEELFLGAVDDVAEGSGGAVDSLEREPEEVAQEISALGGDDGIGSAC